MKKTILLMPSLSTLALLLGLSPLGLRPAHAESAPYEIQKTVGKATTGGTGTATLTVVGRNGWHVNDQAPITVSLKGDSGVDLPKPKLSRADLAQSSKESARFDIAFSATSEGKKTITAETKFVMCMEQACKPVKETVALEVEVAPAGAAPEGKAGAKMGGGKAGKAPKANGKAGKTAPKAKPTAS